MWNGNQLLHKPQVLREIKKSMILKLLNSAFTQFDTKEFSNKQLICILKNSFSSYFIDGPDSAGTGGGSLTGNRAKAFLAPHNREALKGAWKVCTQCLQLLYFQSFYEIDQISSTKI